MSLPHLLRAVGTTLHISVPTIIDTARGRLTRERCDQRLAFWSKRLLEQAQIAMEVQGREHLSVGETYVVMSNHQSLYDIPVLLQALDRSVRMVTKRELFSIPVWGPAMRMAGFVEIDRHDHRSAVASLAQAAELMGSKTDVWISPEGTRSRDGKLLPFRKGGFHLALDTGSKILPISILGTRQVLAAGANRVQPRQTVRVFIHAPVVTAGVSVDDLVERVQSAIETPLVAR